MKQLKSHDFKSPAILLGGPVDYDMYKNFRSQLDGAKKDGLVVTEISTLGGDPEVARMLGEASGFIAKIPRSAVSSFSEKRRFIRPAPHS